MELHAWALHKMVMKTTIMLLMVMTMTMMQSAAASSAPRIQAPWGALQGMRMQGDGGREVDAYLGIPFAEPPLGDLRFEKPQPHPGLSEGEVFAADKVMPACPQKPFLIGTRETSEDCLMLDVYVPTGGEGEDAGPYAVMVWIHGGGMTMGDAFSYRPSRLVADGRVIVVVLQYRLGLLGFFTSGDGILTENLGLWDQNLAFRWVKDNIQAFGGDPGRVTIFGESAGSMSVGLHLLIPESRGLFQRAIMHSGAPLDVVHFIDIFDKKTVFKGFADLVGCEGAGTEELVQCLKTIPLDQLMTKSTEYEQTSPLMNYFFPMVDGDLIPRSPRELLRDPAFTASLAGNVEIIAGFTREEGALVLMMQSLMQLPQEALYTPQFFGTIRDLCLSTTSHRLHPVLKQTTEFYYRGAEMGETGPDSLSDIVDMYGDCLMNMAIGEWMQLLTAPIHTTTTPRYMYVLEHDFACNAQSAVPGAHHGDDIILLFDIDRPLLPKDNLLVSMNKTYMTPQEEQGISRKTVDVWAAFAKTGDPSGPLKDSLEGGRWLPFTAEGEHYLSLSQNPRMVAKLGPYRDRIAFWSKLLPELDAQVAQLPDPQTEGEHQSPTPPPPAAREDL